MRECDKMTRSRIAQPVEPSAEEELDYLHARLLIASLNPETINEDSKANAALARWRALEETMRQDMAKRSHAAKLKLQHLHAVFSKIVLGLAENGHISSQYELGISELVNGNHVNAVQWLKRAAALGHTPSVLQLMKVYCEGENGITKQPVIAKQIYQDHVTRLQTDYFLAFNQAMNTRCSRIQSEYTELVRYTKSFGAIFGKVNPVLNARPRINYLSTEADVLKAIDLLNQVIKLFAEHLFDKEVKWFIANDFHPETKTPVINERSTALLRPMIEAAFIIKPGQITVTDNDLFNLLITKWHVPFHGFTKMSGEFRGCVLSVDDLEMLLKVPTLCVPYTLQFKGTATTQESVSVSEVQTVSRKKEFLILLKRDANLPKWNNKGVTLYVYHVPDLISKMRDKLKSIDENSSYDDCIVAFDEIRKLFQFYAKKSGRDPELESFYKNIVADISSILNEPQLTDSLFRSVRK